MLLPLLTVLLIAAHLFLVRRHGVTPVPEDANLPKKKFYPHQVFKDTVAMFVYTMALALLANFAKVGLGALADPTDTSYIPRPEWYFLFLFQLLKFFEGPLEIVGAIILPTIGMMALFLTPFLDRGRIISVHRRTLAIAVVAVCALSWAGLTQRAVATTPPSLEDRNAGLQPPAVWKELPADTLASIATFRKANCAQCHTLGHSDVGPDLARMPSAKSEEWLRAHFTRPGPEGIVNDFNGAQMKGLVALVTKRDERVLEAWAQAPKDAVDGALIFQSRQCGFCHMLNGVGGTAAPPINGLSSRHDRAWITAHFSDPDALTPGSEMPPYKFVDRDLALITDYLLAIPK